MKIECPYSDCAQRIAIDSSVAGIEASCPTCGRPFICPPLDEFPPEEHMIRKPTNPDLTGNKPIREEVPLLLCSAASYENGAIERLAQEIGFDGLRGALEHSDTMVKVRAIEALLTLKAPRTIDLLIEVFPSCEEFVRVKIQQAIRQLCPDLTQLSQARLLIDPLFGDLFNTGKESRQSIKDMLTLIQPDWMHSDTALTACFEALQLPPLSGTEAAIALLTEIGDLTAIEPLVGYLLKLGVNGKRFMIGAKLEEDTFKALKALGASHCVLPIIPYLRSACAETRCSAARALGRLGDQRSLVPLMDAMADKVVKVRTEVISAIDGVCRRCPATSPLSTEMSRLFTWLAKALSDERDDVRIMAIDTLALVFKEHCGDLVFPLLQDRSLEVRECAAFALADAGDRRSVEMLIATVLKDKGFLDRGKSRRKAINALGRLKAVEAIPVLLTRREAWEARDSSIAALTEIGKNYGDALVAELADRGAGIAEPHQMVLAAVRALGNGIEPSLVRGLRSGDAPIRQAAAEAICGMQLGTTIAPLIDLLQDDTWPVRTSAAKALASQGWKPGTAEERVLNAIALWKRDQIVAERAAALGPMLKAWDVFPDKMRLEAALVLSQLDAIEAFPLLLSAYRELGHSIWLRSIYDNAMMLLGGIETMLLRNAPRIERGALETALHLPDKSLKEYRDGIYRGDGEFDQIETVIAQLNAQTVRSLAQRELLKR